MSGDNYSTDSWIMEMFDGWFDPCPLNPNWTVDGLSPDLRWPNRTFVNPPYSNPTPWIVKAIEENKLGSTIALLLKHDVSTKAYALLHSAKAHILLVNQRLKFNTGKACAFPSMIAILSGQD